MAWSTYNIWRVSTVSRTANRRRDGNRHPQDKREFSTIHTHYLPLYYLILLLLFVLSAEIPHCRENIVTDYEQKQRFTHSQHNKSELAQIEEPFRSFPWRRSTERYSNRMHCNKERIATGSVPSFPQNLQYCTLISEHGNLIFIDLIRGARVIQFLGSHVDNGEHGEIIFIITPPCIGSICH